MTIPLGSDKSTFQDSNLLSFFESFLWKVMNCRFTPGDALSNLGMAYARVLLLRQPPALVEDDNKGSIAKHVAQLTQQNMSDLTTIAMVQGIAATAPIQVMLQESQCLLNYFQQESNEADPGVRLAALKGIHTLISRCVTRSSQEEELAPVEVQVMEQTTETTLEIVLKAWEDPPNRRLGNSIPSLFQKLVSLMEALNQKHSDQNHKETSSTFKDLVMRLLAQPSNRKGRYRALETLLPLVGARRMIVLGGWKLIESLLEGIGDRNSHSAGTIAVLWEKILSDLLQDMLIDEDRTNNGEPHSDGGKKKKTKVEKEFPSEILEKVLPKWWDTWVPSLAAALLSPTASRRKHVAGFCLPKIASMAGGRKQRRLAARTFACLLNAVHAESSSGKAATGTATLYQMDGIWDWELWAILEVCGVCVCISFLLKC